MVHGYFDESGEDSDGYFVMAGFTGKRREWKKYLDLWRLALGKRKSLHMADLRLASGNAPKRYKVLLENLAQVPKTAGLRPLVGSVRVSDYQYLVKDTVAELATSGYILGLHALVTCILESTLSNDDRIEFIFEEQVEFAIARERAFAYWRQMPQYKTTRGKSRIAKSSSIEKSMLLEASDYLAYAFLQRCIDSKSQKASLSSPILNCFKKIPHNGLTSEKAEYLLRYTLSRIGGSQFPAMDASLKATLKKSLKDGSLPIADL